MSTSIITNTNKVPRGILSIDFILKALEVRVDTANVCSMVSNWEYS